MSQLTSLQTVARPPDDKSQVTVKVSRVLAEADDVVGLQLASTDGRPLPAWTPGAHIDLHLPSGAIRQYSLCGDPSDQRHYEIAVLRVRDGRGGSVEVHEALAVGSVLCVSKPRNNFPLEPAARYLFIAGGIGVTPILPMVRAAESADIPWNLIYGGRTHASMAFSDETLVWGGRVELVPQDLRGVPDFDAILDDATDASVYACGPEPMLAALEASCARHLALDLHTERFGKRALVIDEPRSAEKPFEVVLARTGATVVVVPGRSVLEAVRTVAPYAQSSCEDGYCGTCETSVLDGQVDHRDSLLTEEERAANGSMLICVSRAACPRLVLDL